MVIKRLTLVLTCLLCPILAAATPPKQADFDACAKGESQRGVQVKPVEFANLYRDDHNRSGYAVTYAIQNKKKMGFAVKGGQQAIFYDGHVYPIEQADTIHITPDEYQEQLRHAGISLNQPADWYLINHAGARRYLCIALGKPSEKSPSMVYFLSLAPKPRVHFWLDNAP